MNPKLCPRCESNYLDPEEALNALSRRDNKTYICSDCGTEEALEDYFGTEKYMNWLEIQNRLGE
jgi:hypothetical protein